VKIRQRRIAPSRRRWLGRRQIAGAGASRRTRRRRLRVAGRIGGGIAAVAVSAVVLWVMAAGAGPVPPLGPVLDPGHGVWTSAAGAQRPGSRALTVPGLRHPARVWFTSHGVASVAASSPDDAYLTLGYLHARFRLSQLDLQRRLAEGRVAQLAGQGSVSSDEFELRLGLLRTAQREWAQTPRSSPAARALLAYARGVNDYLAQARARHEWPALFTLTGVYPRDWTPVDSLAIQGLLTQQLDFTTTPLDYAVLERTLGPSRTMAWFPVLPRGPQHPYDPGPYRYRGIAPLAGGTRGPAVSKTAVMSPRSPGSQPRPGRAAVATAAAAVLAQVSALPAGLVHQYPDSNAWAANGPAVAGGKSMLAGDPHLPQTLPSIWYQAALSAPGLAVTGVTLPGLPGVVIGHNAHIAWSLTDVQDQATLFYSEKTSKQHPGQYFWHGAWRRMQVLHYSIPVRGGPATSLTVRLTVHGPVLTREGLTSSVDWMGNVASPDVAALLAINSASDFGQFRAALAGWRAPTQNFVYADDRGNIGAISAGYYPLVRHGDPWLPMPGTGADDVAGVIPYSAVPQAYNPPGHLVATANQRPVGASYPYYIGTSANFFDPGYRAEEIYSSLGGRRGLTAGAFAAVQNSLTDPLAQRIVPPLLAALRGQHLTAQQQAAARLLTGWDGSMRAGSAAASLWWAFWHDYLLAVFHPWWHVAKVPVHKSAQLAVSPQRFSLDEDLAQWTVSDPGNPAFTPPGGAKRTAPEAMRAAFVTAVAHLNGDFHGSPASWTWGRLHSRQFPSLTGADALGYGPRPAGGDPWTVDAADGGLTATQGPSWRMIVTWTGPSAARGQGVYPGGQSENPASTWYSDQIADWWAGRYLPMPPASGSRSGVRWVLGP
jgi:penicillin amidase